MLPHSTWHVQVSEELEHRLQLIESSLKRVGMILVSVQGDVMRVNKAIKELSLEAEGIRQKISLFDNSMHQLVRERGIKSSDIQHSIRFQSPMGRNYMDLKLSLKGNMAGQEVAVAPLMRNKGGSPLLKREGKSKSVKLKLTESKHNMRHRHELPHRKQMIFLRKGEQFNGENSGRQYENPKGS
nr:PREDICTED: uncharacterized protein LOC108951710 [Musa acuminata subsp. malaccensis]